jgi:hypothetical protein
MKSDFVIVSADLAGDVSRSGDWTPACATEAWSLFLRGGEKPAVQTAAMPFVLTMGHVMTRKGTPVRLPGSADEEYIRSLYLKYGNDFVRMIKGQFICLICTGKGFLLCNDHLGTGKYFFYRNDRSFIVSNSIGAIAGFAPLQPDEVGVGLFALTHHSPGSTTIFSNLVQSEQASILSYTGERLLTGNYWSVSSLLDLPVTDISFNDFADFFTGLTEEAIHHFRPSSVSLTLTGGYDSRLVLAALLRSGIKPRTFTFGNPLSRDVAIAKRISHKLQLTHNNHYEAAPTAEWFEKLTSAILETGNSLTHYHRAFRLHGVTEEASSEPPADLTMAGFLGGEGLRGAHYENLVIPDFVRRWNGNNHTALAAIENKLGERFVSHNGDLAEALAGKLSSLGWFEGSPKEREFHHLYSLTVCHLSQDIGFYHRYHRNFYAPFMDVDYLEFLFSSPFSMRFRNNASERQAGRLDIPRLYCNVISIMAPALLEIPLTNGYRPADYLRGRIPYLLARGVSSIISKQKVPVFVYDKWFINYLRSEWDGLYDGPVARFYKLEAAAEELQQLSGVLPEGRLHRLTTIIMHNDNFIKYTKH